MRFKFGLEALDRVAAASIAGIGGLMATVTLGSFTRALGAGMACGPDWPVCNGEILPELDFMVALEYFHRVFAGFSALALIYAVASILRSPVYRGLRAWAIATGTLLLAQIILGMIVVKVHLAPAWSALHTTLAIITVATATGMAVKVVAVNSGKGAVKQ